MESQQKPGEIIIVVIIVIEQPQAMITVQRSKHSLPVPARLKLRQKHTITRDDVPCSRVESYRGQAAIQGGFREVDVFQQSGHGRLCTLERRKERDC